MSDIEFTKHPSATDIDFITHMINDETPKYGKAMPFAFFMRDDAEKIVAGANGFVMYGTVYTDQLWVDKTYRSQGYAKKMMGNVHEYAKQEGCKIATVQTMSFQGAAYFYEKLGYVQDFKRSGYIKNSDCIFMRKAL
jgi:GNAT superfamily N-acetyltransferase